MEYLVVYERGEKGYGAYVPDLPGCIAVGETRAEVETLIREAITLHVQELVADGLPLPAPTASVGLVTVNA